MVVSDEKTVKGMELKGRTAIITGAGQGIGRAIADVFGREGANIVVADINSETGESTTKTLCDKGVMARFIQTDVADEDSVSRMLEQTKQEFGGAHILCNNAAVEFAGSIRETELDKWERTLAVNLRGSYLCTRGVIPQFVEWGKGVVINVSSVQAFSSTGRVAAYAASKGALLSLTRDLAQELARYGVRVNAICPGCIDTPMQERALQKLGDVANALSALTRGIPMRRTGRPEEVAEAALFLASERSSYITGIALVVDGGLLCQLPIPRGAE